MRINIVLAAIIAMILGIIIQPSFKSPGRQIIQPPMSAETNTLPRKPIAENKMRLAANGQSNICRTPIMICELPQSGPVGSVCWCIGPAGPVQGVISAN